MKPVSQSIPNLCRAFHLVLNTLQILHQEVVIQPDSTTPLAREILSNKKLWPYFKDCVGALDGTHIPAFLTVGRLGDDGIAPWRNRKGWLSQNVLAVCSFDLKFTFIYAGFEGSAHDATVLKAALEEKAFTPPPGKYYLADAGYYNASFMMIPYDSTRYHLKEWQREGVDRPRNKEELFNLRHASTRNAIERIFGVFKRKFAIIDKGVEITIKQQVALVVGLTALFNFIAIRDRAEDPDFKLSIDILLQQPVERVPDVPEISMWADRESRKEMDRVRDTIAETMWQDYQVYLEQQNK